MHIADGGAWMKKRIEDAFPKARSILDYYHACEHLHLFATATFSDEAKRKKWTDRQKELLLQSKMLTVITNIKKQNSETKEGVMLINYYTNNTGRMDYKRYKSVGAGPIDSDAIQ